MVENEKMGLKPTLEIIVWTKLQNWEWYQRHKSLSFYHGIRNEWIQRNGIHSCANINSASPMSKLGNFDLNPKLKIINSNECFALNSRI